MISKDDLQNTLKTKFDINKNISQSLSKEECEELLNLLSSQPTAVKLINSYSEKNHNLGRNNATYARSRNQTERKFAGLQAEHLQLEASIRSIEATKAELETKKTFLEQERQKLEAEIQGLSSHNQTLAYNVQALTTHNDELTEANTQLKQENKNLKNIVDQIRLRLARDTKLLLQYEDNEIRKALIRLFKWTLG